jgi:acyl-CoA dehydrogenase
LLADDTQRERFRSALAGGRAWAFCGITEPQAGSDAMRMAAGLRPDGSGGYLLSGVKRYIGNASRPGIGVVFARTGTSPAAIRAVLIDGSAPGLRRTALETIGLRGARIGELCFDGVPIARDDLLGNHLSTMRRGFWGAVRAFDNLRVQVGAMTLGTAEAVVDYVSAQRRHVPAAGRAELGRNYLPSVAKLEGVALVRHATTVLPRLLGSGALVEHPLLEKWRRDAMGMEFMEGTAAIQRLTIAQGYLRQGAPTAERPLSPLPASDRLAR